MQNANPTRFEVVVACAVSVPLGIAVTVLAGFAAQAIVPVAGSAALVVVPVLLDVVAVGGGWLVARGDPHAQGFGAGVVTGWVLLALGTAGASAGLGVLSSGPALEVLSSGVGLGAAGGAGLGVLSSGAGFGGLP